MSEILVLGAGMVGVSTALALQARGHQVVLVDRRPPGEETSYGNAGLIQNEAVMPYGLPLVARELAEIAFGRTNSVTYSLGGLWEQGRALLGYAWNSRQKPYQNRVVPNWTPMVQSTAEDHGGLIAASGAGDLIRRDGYRQAYTNPRTLALRVEGAERIRADFGVPFAALDGAGLAQVEPGLKVPMAGAIHWTSAWSCINPGELVKRYARLFEARGGMVRQADAMPLTRRGAGWQIGEGPGTLVGAAAVICLGPWSPLLLARFGIKEPMVLKRGYHRHFTGGRGPLVPFMDIDSSTFLSPMQQGLRVLTGADLARRGEAPNRRQITASERAASRLFDLGSPVEAEPWHGTRPCMPDMRPRIGKVPGQPGLWSNFGHAHQGFTLGPTSGRLLAEAFDAG